MPSLRKQPKSPFYFACFTMPNGKRVQRSTGTMDKDEAMRIAIKFEDAAIDAKSNRFTESRARKTITEIFELTNKEELKASTIKGYLAEWCKRKDIEAADRTAERYKTAVAHFLKELGPGRAEKDLIHLSTRDVQSARDAIAERLSVNSANMVVKVLRTALNQARRDGLVDVNEASRVTLLKSKRQSVRRPFTADELRRLLSKADDEWRGMILTGVYTAFRLGDVCGLQWSEIDLENCEIKVRTAKTGREQVIPIAPPLLSWLMAQPERTGPVFPRAYEAKVRNPHGGPVSNWFHDLLVKAELTEPRTHKKQKEGRGATRQVLPLSFHCLRHTTTSMLKNLGVSDAVAMDIVGHDTVAMSRNYTKIDNKTKRDAINMLPDISKGIE